MGGYFILKGREVIPVADIVEWGRWFETADRRIGIDMVGDVRVSTVFLGLDHSFGHGPPAIFETMIFGGKSDGYQNRSSTWEQAEQQHQDALALVRKELQ